MRFLASVFWLVAGTMHFVIPKQYEAIVPASLHKWRREIVVASGIAEIAGGVLIANDRTRRAGRWCSLATLAAVYPANVEMAIRSERHPKIPPAALWARLPLQFVFGWLTWRGTE
ncbi:MAG TPA: DoxX-like family protein [Thermoleophilaceae bacterium]|nr:DoxX-like family protein [Thermoleophilaceae bacterium]